MEHQEMSFTNNWGRDSDTLSGRYPLELTKQKVNKLNTPLSLFYQFN